MKEPLTKEDSQLLEFMIGQEKIYYDELNSDLPALPFKSCVNTRNMYKMQQCRSMSDEMRTTIVFDLHSINERH